MKDYYMILGVLSNASQDEIKKTYHQLIRKYHPDMGKQSDTERFLEVQEAYEVLGDPDKRKGYDKDKFGESDNRFSAVRPGSSDFDVIFQRLWYSPELWMFSPAARKEPVPFVEKDLCADIILTPAEVRGGGVIPLDVPVWIRCSACNASGSGFPFKCPNCDGRGVVSASKKIEIEIPDISGSEKEIRMNLNRYGIRGYLRALFKVHPLI